MHTGERDKQRRIREIHRDKVGNGLKLQCEEKHFINNTDR